MTMESNLSVLELKDYSYLNFESIQYLAPEME